MNVIENEKQLEITKNWIERFKDGIKQLEEHPNSDIHPLLFEIQANAMQAQIEQLEEQIEIYEQTKNKGI